MCKNVSKIRNVGTINETWQFFFVKLLAGNKVEWKLYSSPIYNECKLCADILEKI